MRTIKATVSRRVLRKDLGTEISRAVPLAVVLGVALLIGACSSGTDPDPHPIEGHWTWVRAFGGIAGTELTPQTAGYPMTVEFGRDHIRVFRADTLYAETTIVLEADNAGESVGTVRYADPVFGWDEQGYEVFPGDSLMLADPCCDGFVYTFRRSP